MQDYSEILQWILPIQLMYANKMEKKYKLELCLLSVKEAWYLERNWYVSYILIYEPWLVAGADAKGS
jgi:hypothetical protein